MVGKLLYAPSKFLNTLALFRLQQFASNLLKCNVASVPCARKLFENCYDVAARYVVVHVVDSKLLKTWTNDCKIPEILLRAMCYCVNGTRVIRCQQRNGTLVSASGSNVGHFAAEC